MGKSESKKAKIYYIFCYARSGGTLLNRFLSNVQDLVVLSEAHPVNFNRPNAGMMSIKEQAREWYGIDIISENYLDAIDEISVWCEENKKSLVLRDWPYIDFAKSNLNNFNPPRLPLNYKLLSLKYDLSAVAFIRDGIDVFLSSKHELNQFAQEYVDYVRYLKRLDVKFYKYEDFCNDYLSTYRNMAQVLGLPENNIKSSSMFQSDRVVGDVKYSRGNVFKEVKILKRRYSKLTFRRDIESNKDLLEANLTLGYEHKYGSREIESENAYIVFKIKSFINRVSNVFGKVFDIR